MKATIAILSLILFGSWCSLSLILLGFIEIPLANSIALPTSTAELGDSIGILNGLFSGLAVLLAVIAVLLQGRELRASTLAQKEQATALRAQLTQQELINQAHLKHCEALFKQLQHQQIANKTFNLLAQQQYHSYEIERMDSVLEKLKGNRQKAQLFSSCVEKKKRHIQKSKEVQKQLEEMETANPDFSFSRQ